MFYKETLSNVRNVDNFFENLAIQRQNIANFELCIPKKNIVFRKGIDT